MYAYNRIPNGGHSTPTPSPPASPSPKIRHGGKSRSSGGGKFTAAGLGGVPGKNYFQRATYVFLSVLHRRQAYCFFAPIIYIAITLYCMSSVIPNISDRPQPGSVYRSQQVFENLWPEINADNYSVDLRSVWRQPHKGGDWRPCTKHKDVGDLPESNGYLLVDANGGLNQQRVSICNAVAVAGYLNATLLIPSFHFHSIWKDASKFKDIYDLDHFVNSLRGVVRIAEEVPAHIMDRYDHNFSKVLNFRVKAWSNAHYYQDVVLPKLLEEKFIRISPFANRLAVDAPPVVQHLRCLANYEALQFANPITTLSEKIVERMRKLSTHNGGNYISVHLRFEEDMVAFSCCVYDWGDAERTEMAAAREKGWRGKFSKRGKIIRPGANRLNGKCPLTPVEVGLMLRGMGFSNTTSIYLASGKIYQAEKMMVPLRQMFPLLQTKDTLASPVELAPFKKFSSRMAAIDYSVCLHSEVFVTTQGGNFPHFLMGHRRYLYGGHSKTIRPDKRKLALLLDNPTIGWENFKKRMVSMLEHSDSKGVEIRRRLDAVYSYPCPDCMCRLNASEVAQI